MLEASPDGVSWLRFAFASTVVIGLLAGLAWGLKALAMRGWLSPRGTGTSRLSITGTLPLDPRRRIVIARCDETEYHLLLGANNDCVLAVKPAGENVQTPCCAKTETTPPPPSPSRTKPHA